MIFISAGHFKGEKQGLGAEEILINMLIRDECIKLMPELISVPDDLTLKQTIGWINERANDNDFAFEIHCNANNDTTIRGVDGYFYQNPAIAKIMAEKIAECSGIPLRGTFSDDKTYWGSLGFLRQVKCDNTLVEVGYLTNPIDRVLLQKHETHLKIAEGIKEALSTVGLWQEKKRGIIQTLTELLKQLQNIIKGRR